MSEWDAGRLDALFPHWHTMPYLAMVKLNSWSKEQGETKLHELIGIMSSGKKAATAEILAAFETFETDRE